MNVITPAQSDQIGADIFAQVCRLDDLAEAFAPPWGAAARDRMRRLCRERMRACIPETKGPLPC